MIESIKRLFAGQVEPPRPGGAASAGADGLRVAACALLLEIAHADDQFTDDERRLIEEALTRHFALTVDQARELMAIAEERRKKSTDLYEFTSLINASYDEGQRLVLAEILWRVVYADQELSRHEDYLMQKLAHLLDLRPGFLAEARKSAAKPSENE
jgi:uncharacterized tellurite resistance protein B-like protein